MTGEQHRLFWMRSAWWCEDCRQKVESCCEGGGCPTIVEVAEVAPAARPSGRPLAGNGSLPSATGRASTSG